MKGKKRNEKNGYYLFVQDEMDKKNIILYAIKKCNVIF